MASLAPPAACGTIKVTGRLGNFSLALQSPATHKAMVREIALKQVNSLLVMLIFNKLSPSLELHCSYKAHELQVGFAIIDDTSSDALRLSRANQRLNE